MSRFSSFKHAPGKTRQLLRDRFSRKLPVIKQALHPDPSLQVLPDQLALRLFAGLTIFPSENWSTAEKTYENAGPKNDEPANLDALAEQGLVRKIWDRVRTSMDIGVAVQRAPSGTRDAFKVLLSGIHDQRYEAAPAIRSDPELKDLVEAIEAGHKDPRDIAIRTPDWVIARLWEMTLGQGATQEDALRRWADLRALLRFPALIPARAWSAADADAFRETALRILSSEPNLGDWTTTRNRYVRQTEIKHDITLSASDPRFPMPPATLVGRALWIQAPSVEVGTYDSLGICHDLVDLVRLLLEDANAADIPSASHRIATTIIDLAIDRAEIFVALLHQVRSQPKLLADLVIHPPSAALACLLIAQWRSPGDAWERTLVERDHQVGRSEAFADAVAILGEHLRAETIAASEAAALLNWLHDRGGTGFIDDVASADSLFTALHGELASCEGSSLLAMAQSLDGPRLRKGLGTSEFATVLDISELGGLEDQVNADTIVTSYVSSIERGDYSLSAHRIGVASAAALVRIAARTKDLRNQFLHPIDIDARFAAASPDDNEVSTAESIGRSLRAHIRILCRAMIGGFTEVPSDLYDALLASVRAGALKHKEKGRVAAFAPRYEKQLGVPGYDRPLADDLGAALTFVDRERQDGLLAAILETDEPLILAQLLSRTSTQLHSRIKQRIAALAPKDAGEIHTLPEMQARIDELLTAGAADAAESYMAAERELQTWGKPPGRQLTRFQNHLRLLFLREDWAALAAEPDPQFPIMTEQATAADTLRQFRALAAIKGPNPNPAFAKQVFTELFAKQPSLAFGTNWLAAEIIGLLPVNNFGLLKGDDIRRGQKAITEVDEMMARIPTSAANDTLECNRALLLLALGEPSQALAILTNTDLIQLRDNAAAYRAIALSRLGRLSEATAALDAAEHTFGRTAVLTAARSHIASGAPFLSVPDVSIYDDLVKNVAAAIARFRLMGPVDQAKVLHSHADPFEALLIEYVRGAADAVVSLVPMMEVTEIDTTEDDLTVFIQHLLAARVQFLGWSAGDQSRGGYSGRGNPGERDLLLKSGNSVLTLIEAVVCDRPLTQDVMRASLESHFQKLLGYGNPRIFFHLTYAYIDDLQGLMRFLETAAETVSPPGFTYIARDPIPHDDSQPPGFVARYSADFGEVKVIFLILNLGQKRQKDAAKIAEATRTRKASTSGGGA